MQLVSHFRKHVILITLKNKKKLSEIEGIDFKNKEKGCFKSNSKVNESFHDVFCDYDMSLTLRNDRWRFSFAVKRVKDEAQ